MIESLHSSGSAWTLHCSELDHPARMGQGVILPVCMVVTGGAGNLVLDLRVMAEPDQRRTERHLWRLVSQHRPPQQLILPDLSDWDKEHWQGFSRQLPCAVRFVPINQLRLPSNLAGEVSREVKRNLRLLPLESAADRNLAGVALVEGARHLSSFEQKRRYLNKALVLAPGNREARMELAGGAFSDGDYGEVEKQCALLLANGLPGPENRESGGWENAEIRLKLRALHLRMLTYWHTGKLEHAVDDAKLLLELNPIDHSGVRFLCPLLCLLAEQDEEARQFFDFYERYYQNDFPDPALLFAWGLVLWRTGAEEEALEKYAAAMVQNLFIAPLLLDLPEPPPDLFLGGDRADPEYAEEFCDSFASLWDRDPEARRGLSECFHAAQPLLERLIKVRQRMAGIQDQRYSSDADTLWKRLQREEQQALEIPPSFRAG